MSLKPHFRLRSTRRGTYRSGEGAIAPAASDRAAAGSHAQGECCWSGERTERRRDRDDLYRCRGVLGRCHQDGLGGRSGLIPSGSRSGDTSSHRNRSSPECGRFNHISGATLGHGPPSHKRSLIASCGTDSRVFVRHETALLSRYRHQSSTVAKETGPPVGSITPLGVFGRHEKPDLGLFRTSSRGAGREPWPQRRSHLTAAVPPSDHRASERRRCRIAKEGSDHFRVRRCSTRGGLSCLTSSN